MKRLRRTAFLSMLFILAASFLYGNERTNNTAPPRDERLSAFERQLVAQGFRDVQEVDPTLKVELKYACAENFMGAAVYGELRRCYLRPEAAGKLAEANRRLREINPRLTLLVVDGLRPRHVQWKMRKLLQGTPLQNYVAEPRAGSMHNYGCAVDLTVVDDAGNRLDMGTPMDHFGILSQPRHEVRFLKEGKLTAQQVENRRLLRRVMVAAGFRPLPIEWWHFDAFDKSFVRRTYTIVE